MRFEGGPEGFYNSPADAIITQNGVAKTEYESLSLIIHDQQACRSTSIGFPFTSKIVTCRGICPGREWVAQPKQGS